MRARVPQRTPDQDPWVRDRLRRERRPFGRAGGDLASPYSGDLRRTGRSPKEVGRVAATPRRIPYEVTGANQCPDSARS